MADFSITISNEVRCFGNEVSSKWGDGNGAGYTFVWGTSLWGYGFTIPLEVEKLISEAVTPTCDVSSIEVEHLVSNSLSVSFETETETLRNGIWDVVFVSDTTNAENRDFASWTSQSVGTVSYTCGASISTTTWS